MSIYLVTIGCNVNDVPVYVTTDKRKAYKAASRLKPDSYLRERQICDMEHESPVCSWVNEFTDDGVLVSQRLVCELTGDYLMAPKPGELF